MMKKSIWNVFGHQPKVGRDGRYRTARDRYRTASGSDRIPPLKRPLTLLKSLRFQSRLSVECLVPVATARGSVTDGLTIFILLNVAILTACQSASSGSQQPVSARTLAEEYEQSSAAVRSKYDGKEIIVSGYAMIAAKLPQSGDDQGSVLLEEKGRNTSRQVACWFSKDQAEQFSKIKGEQYITVRGIFNGEAGAELKFCKLVKIE